MMPWCIQAHSFISACESVLMPSSIPGQMPCNKQTCHHADSQRKRASEMSMMKLVVHCLFWENLALAKPHRCSRLHVNCSTVPTTTPTTPFLSSLTSLPGQRNDQSF